MWRIILLGALGVVIGFRARSERGVVLLSLLFGLMFGGVEVLSNAALAGSMSSGRALFLLGLGLVLAMPVYAIAEIWRRTRTRAIDWLRRLIQ
jgi:hypothetical protein